MKIGKGSFGHVFLAKKMDDKDDKYYAIKILSKALIMGKFYLIAQVRESFKMMTIVNPFYEV